MPGTYRYRVVKAAWGIAIDFTAEAVPVVSLPANAIRVTDTLWLSNESKWRWSEEERYYLLVGLRLVAEAVTHYLPNGGPVLVRVLDVWFHPCDYQPEGLAAAITGWAAQEFRFPEPSIPVSFDKAANRYVFELPDPVHHS